MKPKESTEMRSKIYTAVLFAIVSVSVAAQTKVVVKLDVAHHIAIVPSGTVLPAGFSISVRMNRQGTRERFVIKESKDGALVPTAAPMKAATPYLRVTYGSCVPGTFTYHIYAEHFSEDCDECALYATYVIEDRCWLGYFSQFASSSSDATSNPTSIRAALISEDLYFNCVDAHVNSTSAACSGADARISTYPEYSNNFAFTSYAEWDRWGKAIEADIRIEVATTDTHAENQ